MSILIIGDSYAAQGSVNERDAEHSYQNILRNQYGLTVDNYGFPGHSFFKIYKQLIDCLDNINDYKLVVILATTPGRLYIPNCKIGVGGSGNADHLMKRYEQNDVPEEHGYPSLNQVIAAKEYYKNLKDPFFDSYIQYALEDSIKTTLEKLSINHVLIPVNNVSLRNKEDCEWTLMDMTFKQLGLVHNTPKNYSMEKYREIHGRILNHLTVENNQAFADFIFRKYNGSTDSFDNKVFKPATVNDFYYYYTSIDN